MSRVQKSALMLFTIALLVSILFALQSASAQEETPSVPQFTVKARQNSFDITILNQKFSNTNTPVYFDIRIRYNSYQNWAETYGGYQSSGDYTVLTFQLNEIGRATESFGGFVFSDETVQFQVLRSTYRGVGRSVAPPNNYIYAGSNSSWSGTQTCTFPAQPTPTPSPYHAQPTQATTVSPQPSSGSTGTPDRGNIEAGSNGDWMQLVTWTLLSVIIALLLVVIFYLRKRSH